MENESFKSNCSIKNFYTDNNYLAIVISKSTRNTHKMWLVVLLLDIVVASPESFAPFMVTILIFIWLAKPPKVSQSFGEAGSTPTSKRVAYTLGLYQAV